jgi:hypothetical protein
VGSAPSRRGEAGLRATGPWDRDAVPRPAAPPHLFGEGRVEGEERSRKGSGTGTAGGSARRSTERRGRGERVAAPVRLGVTGLGFKESRGGYL